MAVVLPQTLPVVEAGSPGSRVALVLHGGGGPRTVAPIVARLASSMHVFAPTHPGWDGTDRPGSVESVADLATGYLAWLLDRGHRDVVVVGSSLGGWIALEMALQCVHDRRYAGLVGAVVDIDGVGAVVDGEPMADFFALDARGLAEAAWHDPDRGYLDPARLTDDQRAMQQANGRAMGAIAGPGMSDATLLGRLAAIDVPTLVVWGESDRIVTPAYGRAVADVILGARFVRIGAAGHLPHLEAPEATFGAIEAFLGPWSVEYQVDTDLEPQAVWRTLIALETGAIAKGNGDQHTLDGALEVGGTLTSSSEGIPPIRSTIVELVDGERIAIRTEFQDLVLLLRNSVVPGEGGRSRLVRRLEITGPGAADKAAVAGPRISSDYADTIAEVVDLAGG